MSTNTYAVDYEGRRVFDLGNHSTALLFEDSRAATYTRDGLQAAKDNVRVVRPAPRLVSYGVDASGKFAVDQCCAWMEKHGVEAVDLVTESSERPWLGDECGWTLDPAWTYFTPFRNSSVEPDPYTLRGEVYFRAEVPQPANKGGA